MLLLKAQYIKVNNLVPRFSLLPAPYGRVGENPGNEVELFVNRHFYRYDGHIELIRFKEYYWMPRGHELDPIYTHSAASYPDVSLLMKMCAQRKAGRRQRARLASPAVCTLPMVPCGSSPVTRVALASAMRKTKRLRRRLLTQYLRALFGLIFL